MTADHRSRSAAATCASSPAGSAGRGTSRLLPREPASRRRVRPATGRAARHCRAAEGVGARNIRSPQRVPPARSPRVLAKSAESCTPFCGACRVGRTVRSSGAPIGGPLLREPLAMAAKHLQQSCGLCAGVAPGQLDLVGLAEAAELLDVSKAVLCERRRGPRPDDSLPVFPKPVAELKCGPVWLRSQVESYREAWERAMFLRRSGQPRGPIDQALERVLAQVHEKEAANP